MRQELAKLFPPCFLTCIVFLAGCTNIVTFNVNTNQDLHDTDVGDMLCVADASAGLCSLRAAIEQANAFAPGTTRIVINVPPDTYSLSALKESQLTINAGRFVEIAGANAANTIVQPDKGVNARVFHILGGLFRLSGLTIRNGRAPPLDDRGGGMRIEGAYGGEISDCVFENNFAAFAGGAIYATGSIGASLIINDSIIRNNESSNAQEGGGGFAAGLFANVEYLSLHRVTISGNIGSNGAGLFFQGEEAEIWDSVINQNQGGIGGGIGVVNGSMFIGRSTISGNSAIWAAGGIYASNADVRLRDVTIFENRGPAQGPNGETTAGGLEQVSGGSVMIRNSILAGNRRGPKFTEEASDCAGTLTSNGFNFIGSNLDCTIDNQNNDQIGTANAALDPQLGGLGNNGGATQNHLPEATSLVIDAGSGCFAVDQRGQPRPKDGNGDNLAVCDIGAVER